MLPNASRNHASKIYHAEASARPGIGSEIGNAEIHIFTASDPAAADLEAMQLLGDLHPDVVAIGESG